MATFVLTLLAAPAAAEDVEGELRALVTELSDDALGGRVPAGVGEMETIAIVTRQFAAAGLEPAGTIPQGGGWLQPVTLPTGVDATVKPRVSHNIVGRLPGTDPTAGTVLLLAHWDAQGTCGPPDVADRICNGAVDNASGTAALMVLARRLAAAGPRTRAILFVATTAEEQGLIGATALAALPIVPLASIAAVVNMDTIAVAGPEAPVAVIGGGPEFKVLVAEAAAERGRTLDTDAEADVYLQRQDGWAFGRLGVTAAMVTGSFSDLDALAPYLARDYHQASDEVDRARFDGAAADVAVYEGIVERLADPTRWTIPPINGFPPPLLTP